jgi:hypothetical protein
MTKASGRTTQDGREVETSRRSSSAICTLNHPPDIGGARADRSQFPQARRGCRLGQFAAVNVSNQAVMMVDRLWQIEENLQEAVQAVIPCSASSTTTAR